MNQPPICSKIYKSELQITEEEISKLKKLRYTVQIFGLVIILIGIISLFFPSIISTNLKLDNLSKFVSIFFGGIFFSTINFFNKGDMRTLKIRKIDLEVFIEEYEFYDSKSVKEQKRINEECEKIIQKKKGL